MELHPIGGWLPWWYNLCYLAVVSVVLYVSLQLQKRWRDWRGESDDIEETDIEMVNRDGKLSPKIPSFARFVGATFLTFLIFCILLAVLIWM